MRWFIALRYFLSHKRQSLVCIAGVVISVMMFLIMTSMMNGLTSKFIVETVESSGHITIKDEPRESRTAILEARYPESKDKGLLALEGTKPREQTKKIRHARTLMKVLDAMPDVVAVAPMVNGNAIATYGTKTLNWTAPKHSGDYDVTVTATDLAGNTATAAGQVQVKKRT